MQSKGTHAPTQWEGALETLRVGVGSSFLWAWGFLCYLSPAMFPSQFDSSTNVGLENGFFASQGVVVLFAITLLVISRLRTIRVHRGVLLAAALATCASSVGISFALNANLQGLMIICGAIDGISVTLLSCAWGARFSLGTKRTRPLVVISFLLAYLEYLLVPLIPSPIDDIVIVLLPIGSWLLWRIDAGARHAQTFDVFPTTTQAGKMPGEVSAGAWETRLLPWRQIAILIAASFVGNLVSSFLMGASYELATTLFSMATIICALIATMSLVPLAYSDDTLSVPSLYRLTLSFTAVGLVGILVFGESAFGVGGMFTNGAAFFLQVIVYVVITQSIQEEGLSPLLAFAVGQALISGVVLCGHLMGKQLPTMLPGDIPTLSVICGASMLLLFFMLIAQTETLASTAPGAPESAPVAPTEPAEQAREETSEKDALEERMARICEANGLTKREAEVYRYLARGRSLPYIADALFVTTGTVKTHTTHIYRKLGVSSKQELMDMLEETP